MDINGNKNSFYHCSSIKWLNKENTGHLLNGDGDLKKVELGKTKVASLPSPPWFPGLKSLGIRFKKGIYQ